MPGPACEYRLLGAICGKGALLLGTIGGPAAAAAIGAGACIPKAKGSVIGWLLDGGTIISAGGPLIATGGPIIAAGAVDVCLRGLSLRKTLGPAEEGPEAPGGPFRGGGCMVLP